MASTQKLTELPTIQYTGMDYETVISQIQEIINNNSNWKQNWTQFQNSEAGTLLIQLMAWICDNLAVRQDLIYNEQFLSTATSQAAKLRLLNQIGYVQETTSASIVPIEIELDRVATDDMEISCCTTDNSIASIKNSILRFTANDINGKLVPWEVLHVNKDGSIDYQTPIKLPRSSALYKTYTKRGEPKEYQLQAVQGTTYYKEFFSDTDDEPVFDLGIDDFDLKTLAVFDITDGNKKHIKVNNFIDISLLDNGTPCYIVEKNDSGSFQIRYQSSLLAKRNEKLNNKFIAGHTVGVLYRTSNGSDGNIPANYWSVTATAKFANSNNRTNIKISNVLSGYNGENGESLTDAVKNAPLSLRTMERAVTTEDYDRILSKNDLVLNCKTYTPDNMPFGFEKYYGRKINPQEAFSLAILNKNFNDIKGSDLNHFPWVEMNKTHNINEKYSFGDCALNNEVSYSKICDNIYIKTDDKFDEENIHNNLTAKDNFKNGEKENRQIFYRNAAIFETNNLFGQKIINEKNTAVSTERSNKNPYELKIKTHKDRTEAKFIKNIYNATFNDSKNSFAYLSTDNNVIQEDDHATYTSLRSFAENEAIGVSHTGEYTVILDDNINISISPFDIEKIVSVHTEINGEHINEQEILSTDASTIEGYYTQEDDNSEYYINLKSNKNEELSECDYVKDAIEKNSNSVSIKSVLTSQEIAKTRTSFIDMLKGEYNRIFKKINIITDTIITPLGDPKLVCDDIYIVENNENKKIVCKKINEEYKELNNKSFGDNEEEWSKEQSEYIESALMKNVCYQDLGLKIPEKYTSFRFGTEPGDPNSNDFDTFEIYGKSVKEFFFANALNSEQPKERWYRIKINGIIYAFRIDEKTIQEAMNYYNSFKVNNDNNKYIDLFKYIGKGYYLNGPWIGISDDQLDNAAVLNNGVYSYKLIKSNFGSGKYQSVVEGKYYYLTIDMLVMVLNYLVSELSNAIDEGNIKYFNNGSFISLKDIGGEKIDYLFGVHFDCVEKKHYNYNSITTKENLYFKEVDDYKDGTSTPKEYDIRVESIFGKTLEISSVKAEDVDSSMNDLTTEDLLENIFGIKKDYVTSVPDDDDLEADKVFSTEKDGFGFDLLKITSPKKGQGSSIYIKEYLAGARQKTSISNDILGLLRPIEEHEINGNHYIFSNKAYGIRRQELYVGDKIEKEGQEIINNRKITNSPLPTSDFSDYISIGDIIANDSDINFVNVGTKYISYLLSNVDYLTLNKSKNFRYSYNEKANDLANPLVSGIDGQVVYFDEDTRTYKIDKKSSDFNIYISDSPLSEDVNSVYNIKTDGIDGIIKNDIIKLHTTNLENYTDDDNVSYIKNEDGYKLEKVENKEVKLQFSIDEETPTVLTSYNNLKRELDSFISIDLSIDTDLTVDSLYKLIYNEYKKKISDNPETNYASKTNLLVRKDLNEKNKLYLSNIDRRESGNITFYFSVSSDQEQPIDETAVNMMYKKIFGTNITNPEFYALYSADVITDYNDADVIHRIIKPITSTGRIPPEGADDANSQTYGATNEYYYAPTKEHALKFVFRAFTNEEKTESRYGDYYISCTGNEFYKNSNKIEDLNNMYKFNIVKTTHSTIPETDFYVHYINDRTYEQNRFTEEDAINEYMKKYMIAGTELKFLNPYFKTFDISGIVYYDPNYDISVVKNNINVALENKYTISNIKNITIGNKVYLSDIVKIISNINGVDHVVIDYFGYDITNKNDYPTTNNYISSGEDQEFYTMTVLAATDNTHGIQLSYEQNLRDTSN